MGHSAENGETGGDGDGATTFSQTKMRTALFILTQVSQKKREEFVIVTCSCSNRYPHKECQLKLLRITATRVGTRKHVSLVFYIGPLLFFYDLKFHA